MNKTEMANAMGKQLGSNESIQDQLKNKATTPNNIMSPQQQINPMFSSP